MSLSPVFFTAITALCFLEPSTLSLAQISGSGSSSAASPAGTPSAGGGGSSGTAPTPGQSITIPPNTQATPQGIGPAPAPTPGQSTTTGPRPLTTIDSLAARTPPTLRQTRMRNARKPRQAETVGSGSSRPESPSRPECFQTTNILKESERGGNQPEIAMPSLSPKTGRAAATKTRC